MKKTFKINWLTLFILSFSLSSEEMPEQELVYLGKSSVNLIAHKQNCSLNYRLPSDFNGVNTFAEVLIWQIQEESSYFVATPTQKSALDPVFNNSQIHGNLQKASFNWSGGIRVGLGYTFIQDSWQILSQYTWFNTRGKNSFTAPLSNTQFLMSSSTSVGFGPTKASSTTNFAYQIGDLLLARRFLMNESVQINPFLGATGGYIKENLDFIYYNSSLSFLTGPTSGIPLKNYNSNSWKFCGGGFRVGTDANWHMGQGFGFFGRISFAGILGQYTNHNRITADTPGISTFATVTAPHIRNTVSRGIFLLPTSQIIIGFDWSRLFINSSIKNIRIAIAGEFNHLSNLQVTNKTLAGPMPSPGIGKASIRDKGTVYIYGANVRLGLDF